MEERAYSRGFHCGRRSVHKFAEEFKKRKQPLNVLLNNGGDFSPPDNVTEDGFEVTACCFLE